ncbi:MAG: BON domain-containing protein [Polyangiaceae bacterium]
MESPATPTTPAQDQKITQSVHKTLMADKTLSAPAGVKITTSSGKVTLKGTVVSDDEKDRIESEVKKVPGVQSVDNELKVQKK